MPAPLEGGPDEEVGAAEVRRREHPEVIAGCSGQAHRRAVCCGNRYRITNPATRNGTMHNERARVYGNTRSSAT